MFARLKNKLSLIFTKSWSFLRPKNKLGVVSVIVLSSLVVIFLLVNTKIAQAVPGIPSIEDIMGWFASIFFSIAGFFIRLTFWVLKFVIEVAGYNGYIDSPAVTVGWVMVRDMTNMFFIVLLLIISFGTILGLEHYEYKKLLVKVLLAAVIVNFSRIICGVIIDIAQIVMITFVNGIAATASGNLVQMFSIDEIFKLGNGASAVKLDAGPTFIASIAALVFGTMMLVTMATFLFLLMARMAMLWVLIVLSPFAFVLNVLPQTEKYASQWWSEFGGNVLAGPIIAFFLWLSFVTVGSGAIHDDIRAHNALKGDSLLGNDPESKEESTGITKVMSWTKMANFVIAIAMLLAGAKMATELGAAGADMMGKAKDIGKKVAMTASGLSAARWAGAGAYGLAAKGVKAGGKKVLMKFPLIGGNAWIRRGKEVGGWAGRKLAKFDRFRNRVAKSFEDDNKKERDLEFKKKHKQITNEQYEEGMAKIKEDREKLNSGGSGLDNVLMKMFNNNAVKGVLASVWETQGRKMERADKAWEAYEAEQEADELDYSVSSSWQGEAKRESEATKQRMEKLKHEKGERKADEMQYGALMGGAEGDLEGKEARDILNAEMQKRGVKAQVEEQTVGVERQVYHGEKGEKMYEAESRARMAKKGHHAEEEEEGYKQDIKLIEAELEKLKNEVVTTVADGEKKQVKIGALEEQLESKRGALEQMQSGVVDDGQFSSKEMLELIKQLQKASKTPADSTDRKVIMDKIQGEGADPQLKQAYMRMFGVKKVEDLLASKRSLAALGEIEKAITEKNEKGEDLTGVSGSVQDVLGKVFDSVAESIQKGSTIVSGAWERMAKTSPSLYAARSEALRDHQYAFYRGKTQDVKDKAAQGEIWDKMGILIPGGAAQQAVAEELYAKHFKGMKYNQAMAAQRGFQDYLAGKINSGQRINDRDRLIGMAIVQRGVGESQVDDSMIQILEKVGVTDPQQMINEMKKRVVSQVVRLARDEISTLAKSLTATLSGVSQTMLESIRQNDSVVIQKFIDDFGRDIQNNSHQFNGLTAEKLVELIRQLQPDQYDHLMADVKKANP